MRKVTLKIGGKGTFLDRNHEEFTLLAIDNVGLDYEENLYGTFCSVTVETTRGKETIKLADFCCRLHTFEGVVYNED